MKSLSLREKLINFGYGIKYKIKNSTPERKEALAKLNKRPFKECMGGITDVVAKTLNGLYVRVEPDQVGINIKYKGVVFANRSVRVYWDKHGLGLSSTIAIGSLDIGGFSIAEIVDFTPIVKDDTPDVVVSTSGLEPYPNIAIKAHEMHEKHIEQIRRNIQLLDKVLSKENKPTL